MAFKRGFKTECERLSLEVRREIGLAARDRFVPEEYAAELAIPVLSVSAFREFCPEGVTYLLVTDPSALSAVTLFNGTKRTIIYNPGHSPGRRANSIAHELAHVLLEHVPGEIRETSGQRRWRPLEEAEADWLAGALLAPREGMVELMYEGLSLDSCAQHFGVSVALMRWRLNHTGVMKQLHYAAQRAGV